MEGRSPRFDFFGWVCTDVPVILFTESDRKQYQDAAVNDNGAIAVYYHPCGTLSTTTFSTFLLNASRCVTRHKGRVLLIHSLGPLGFRHYMNSNGIPGCDLHSLCFLALRSSFASFLSSRRSFAFLLHARSCVTIPRGLNSPLQLEQRTFWTVFGI